MNKLTSEQSIIETESRCKEALKILRGMRKDASQVTRLNLQVLNIHFDVSLQHVISMQDKAEK